MWKLPRYFDLHGYMTDKLDWIRIQIERYWHYIYKSLQFRLHYWTKLDMPHRKRWFPIQKDNNSWGRYMINWLLNHWK